MASCDRYVETIIDNDDIRQEIALKRLEGNTQTNSQIMIDVLKRRANWCVIQPNKVYLFGHVEQVDRLYSREIIRHYYKLLNRKQRLIFSLFVFKDMTHKEIADHLGYERSAITKIIGDIKKVLRLGNG